MLNSLLLFSATSFIFFGVGCFVSSYLKAEFIRYGLPQFRLLTGLLQLIGGLGIGIGFWWPTLQLVSTAGLAILMLLGFGVRLKIRDNFVQSFPAFFYFILNLYLSNQLYSNL
ncbi:MAG: DoxX family protein [Flavobacteriaceae bacterium]|nr:DoxX family protein [Flavobacteriaceae bacterium]